MRTVYVTELPWEERGISLFGDPHTFKDEALTEQLRSDLVDAKERGDMIVLWGDIHDWILPSDKKRFTSGKHNVAVDAVINQTVSKLADFYEPFADHIAIMKLGNHETAVIKYHHVDPMQMLVSELNRRRSSDLPPIFYGGYTMWWLIRMIGYTGKGDRTRSASVKMWLHHGAGGSAPVTRGAIDRARIYDAVTADVVAIGHKHQSMHITTKHERLDDYGNVKREDRDFLLLAGYSGWDNSAPNDEGYLLNWSGEQFYGLESTGCKRLRLVPVTGNTGTGRANRIERIVEARSM
jgi:hypothetical protein